jgi:hypothetical protein
VGLDKYGSLMRAMRLMKPPMIGTGTSLGRGEGRIRIGLDYDQRLGPALPPVSLDDYGSAVGAIWPMEAHTEPAPGLPQKCSHLVDVA